MRFCASPLPFTLPAAGRYGAGLVFLPHDERDRDRIKDLIARIADEEGQTLLGWRDVPTDNSLVGPSARVDAAAFRAGVHRRRVAGRGIARRVRRAGPAYAADDGGRSSASCT